MSPAMMKSMGDRLREARSAKFDSAGKAAEALGISASTYRAHENGQNEFGPDEAERYARKFGISAAYLLTGDTSNGAKSLHDSELAIRNIRKLWGLLGTAIQLDPGDQEQIISLIEPQIKELSRRSRRQARTESGG